MTEKVKIADVITIMEGQGWTVKVEDSSTRVSSFSKTKEGFRSATRNDILTYFRSRIEYLSNQRRLNLIEASKGVPQGTPLESALSILSESGLFKIVPQVTTKTDIPMLVFRHDKFLSWYRGYRFQVSGTQDGNGNYGSSEETLERDLMNSRYLNESLQSLIAFSHVCEASNKFEDLWEYLNSNPELLNEFMNKTNAEENILCEDFDFNEIKNRITETDTISPSYNLLLCTTENKGKDDYVFGNLAVANNYIAIKQFKDTKWKQLHFSGYTHESELSKREYYDLVLGRLIWILLNNERIHMDYYGIYPYDKKDGRFIPTSSFSGLEEKFIWFSRDWTKFIREVVSTL